MLVRSSDSLREELPAAGEGDAGEPGSATGAAADVRSEASEGRMEAGSSTMVSEAEHRPRVAPTPAPASKDGEEEAPGPGFHLLDEGNRLRLLLDSTLRDTRLRRGRIGPQLCLIAGAVTFHDLGLEGGETIHDAGEWVGAARPLFRRRGCRLHRGGDSLHVVLLIDSHDDGLRNIYIHGLNVSHGNYIIDVGILMCSHVFGSGGLLVGCFSVVNLAGPRSFNRFHLIFGVSNDKNIICNYLGSVCSHPRGHCSCLGGFYGHLYGVRSDLCRRTRLLRLGALEGE